jgi:hypothetical protein
MTTRQANYTILLVFGGYILYRIIYPVDENDAVGNLLLNIAIEMACGILLLVLLNLFQNIRKLWFFFQTRILHRNKEIRLSLAYVFRIKVNGQYLLIKSRNRNYFQPVGGVYKTLPSSKAIFDKLQVRSDRIIETDHGIAKGDLRIYVPGRNVMEFLDWYHSKEDREISPWREFCEELISPGYLPWKEFRYIDYQFKGTVSTPIFKLDSGDMGMFMYDVFDLLPNDEQLPILKSKLSAGNTTEYLWTTEYLIKRLGHNESTKQHECNLSPHTKWTHNLKWSNE